MHKVQLTLTTQEADLLNAKAAQLGYSLTKYIKFLLGSVAAEIVQGSEIPAFQMSKNATKIASEARKIHQKGQTREIKSFAELEE